MYSPMDDKRWENYIALSTLCPVIGRSDFPRLLVSPTVAFRGANRFEIFFLIIIIFPVFYNIRLTGGSVARRLEHWPRDWEIAGSNPAFEQQPSNLPRPISLVSGLLDSLSGPLMKRRNRCACASGMCMIKILRQSRELCSGKNL